MCGVVGSGPQHISRGGAGWEEHRAGVGPLVRHERYRNVAWVTMAGKDGG
jgi:hypothetical protein